MNNLVHIPTTPAAQREKKKGMRRGRKMSRWRERGTDREEDKSKGESEGWVKRGKKEKGGVWQMIANVCQGIT